MKRRAFLQSVTTLIPGITFATGLAPPSSALRHCTVDDTLRELLATCLPDTETARRIGDIYLATSPDIAAGAVRRTRRLLETGSSGSIDYGVNMLAKLQQRDFSAGRTLTIDGWVIARCEADLCATLTRFHAS